MQETRSFKVVLRLREKGQVTSDMSKRSASFWCNSSSRSVQEKYACAVTLHTCAFTLRVLVSYEGKKQVFVRMNVHANCFSFGLELVTQVRRI